MVTACSTLQGIDDLQTVFGRALIAGMTPKHHSTLLSGSDRKALKKELALARAMTTMLAEYASEKRAAGEALIRDADDLLCQSWNERMWSDGGPPDPSPSIDQAIGAGFRWLKIRCTRCHPPRAVDLATLSTSPQPASMTSRGADVRLLFAQAKMGTA